ncbi:camp-dependent protein kinase catalytic subunit [Thoreauomyces humboldtii]|nr:camp-dependent protein kinase catalytic subunit [Thoreauomyces humboldtii]
MPNRLNALAGGELPKLAHSPISGSGQTLTNAKEPFSPIPTKNSNSSSSSGGGGGGNRDMSFSSFTGGAALNMVRSGKDVERTVIDVLGGTFTKQRSHATSAQLLGTPGGAKPTPKPLLSRLSVKKSGGNGDWRTGNRSENQSSPTMPTDYEGVERRNNYGALDAMQKHGSDLDQLDASSIEEIGIPKSTARQTLAPSHRIVTGYDSGPQSPVDFLHSPGGPTLDPPSSSSTGRSTKSSATATATTPSAGGPNPLTRTASKKGGRTSGKSSARSGKVDGETEVRVGVDPSSGPGPSPHLSPKPIASQRNNRSPAHVGGDQERGEERESLDDVIKASLAPPVERTLSVGRPIERAVSVHQRGPFKYELGDFVLQKSLGQGAFAKVYLVKRNIDGKLFALKSMRKDNVVKMQQVQHVQNERHLMENIRNPFLVGLEATFQDSQHIFMIIDYMPGGDLFGQIQKLGHFDESLARFYATEVAMALSYLHSENIVYRDLKPENVLLDGTGHAKLGDFGFAKVIDGTTRTFCGTPSYIPPEILLHKEYSSAVDWWSFGVLLFEMLSGCSPFQEDTAARTYERILQGTIQWPSYRSKYFSRSAEDLIVALLVFSPFKRLGCQDESEIRDHPFFASVDWRMVKTRKQIPVTGNHPLRRSASSGNGFLHDAAGGAGGQDANPNPLTSFEISAWRSNSCTARAKQSTTYSHELFKDF